MDSAPGMDFLPLDQQQLFAHEFQKDVEFLQFLDPDGQQIVRDRQRRHHLGGRQRRPAPGDRHHAGGQGALLALPAMGPAGSQPALLQRGQRLWPARRRILRRLRKCGREAGGRKRPGAGLSLSCRPDRYRGAGDRGRAPHRDALQRTGADRAAFARPASSVSRATCSGSPTSTSRTWKNPIGMCR